MPPEFWSPFELASAWPNYSPQDLGEGGLQPGGPPANTPAGKAYQQQAGMTGAGGGTGDPYNMDILAWLQQNFYDGIVAVGAVGVMLVGLWMIAGSPKPQVIPIPA